MKMDGLQTNRNLFFLKQIQGKETMFSLLFLLLMISSFSCKSLAQVTGKDSLSLAGDLVPNMKYTLVDEIEIKGERMTTDKLLNCYIITNENELVKFSPQGKELYRYSNFDLGEISYTDASNPFNILIFYEEYQIIEILDRTLGKTTSFDLSEADLLNVRAVAISSNQQIWIYDELNFKLKKLNVSGNIVFESADLSNLLVDNFSPTFMIEKGGNIYLSQANHSVFVFDVFGNYISTEPLDISTGKLQVLQGLYIYRKNRIFYINNPMLGDIHISELITPKTTTEIIDAEIQKDHMFVLLEDRLSIYTFAEIK